MSVWETMYVDEQTNATTVITNIFGITGQTWQIDEPLLEVVARLNEKD
jgi:hypothetical protein